jgi:hypothetical protein
MAGLRQFMKRALGRQGSSAEKSKPEPVKPRRWNLTTAHNPWFDQPDAAEHIEKRQQNEILSAADVAVLQSWSSDGYAILKNAVSSLDIDAMVKDVDDLWTRTDAINGLNMVDLKLDPDLSQPARTISHAEVLAIPLEERLAVRDRSQWRIHGFHWHSAAARKIFDNPEIARVASLIMGEKADPTFTINFVYGSRQSLHQDTCVFHAVPPSAICGVWLACEDISPDSGPLVYYPKSQKEPLFPEFDNYPQTNLRTMPRENMQNYYDYVNSLAQKYDRHQFLARKGDVLLWHGMLIHGGDEVRNPELTRKSYVCHYHPPHVDRSGEIAGPFNW